MDAQTLYNHALTLKAATLELASQPGQQAAQLNLAASHIHDAANHLSLAGGLRPTQQDRMAELEAELAELRSHATPGPTQQFPGQQTLPDQVLGINPADAPAPPKSNAVEPEPPQGVTFAKESNDASFAGDAVASTDASPEVLAAEQAARSGRDGADVRQTDPVDPQAG